MPEKYFLKTALVIAKDDIKVSVILASKYEVKAKNFIIPTLSTVTSLLQHHDYFQLYSLSFFKASKEQKTINEILKLIN